MADARCWLGELVKTVHEVTSYQPHDAQRWSDIQETLTPIDRMIDGQVVIGYNPNIGGTVSMSPVEWEAKEKARQAISDYKKHYQEQLDCLYRLISEASAKAAKVQGEDPDGSLVPMKPAHPIPERTITAPQHDFIAALYRPYNPVV